MEAAELLRAYLDETEGMTYEKAGAELNVSRQTIWAWISRGSVPSEAVRREIERLTDGKVPASAWPVVDRRKPTGSAA